jgi:hypothetical protein
MVGGGRVLHWCGASRADLRSRRSIPRCSRAAHRTAIGGRIAVDAGADRHAVFPFRDPTFQRFSRTFHRRFRTPRHAASTVQASLHHFLETCMYTDPNRFPAGIAAERRLLWLAPLILALFGCGGGGSADVTAGDATAVDAQAPPASIAEPLTGQWETILTYVPPFYSGPYGDVPNGDGAIGITLVVTADGRYRHVWNLTSAYFGGNCFRTGGWDEFGTLSGTGPEFTFNPTKASYIQTDTCGQNKFLDPAPVAPASHTLAIEHDNTGWPLLRITFPTGDIVLEKCRHCG